MRRHYNPIVLALMTMPKPVVACVNGMAAGAGRLAGARLRLPGAGVLGPVPDGLRPGRPRRGQRRVLDAAPPGRARPRHRAADAGRAGQPPSRRWRWAWSTRSSPTTRRSPPRPSSPAGWPAAPPPPTPRSRPSSPTPPRTTCADSLEHEAAQQSVAGATGGPPGGDPGVPGQGEGDLHRFLDVAGVRGAPERRGRAATGPRCPGAEELLGARSRPESAPDSGRERPLDGGRAGTAPRERRTLRVRQPRERRTLRVRQPRPAPRSPAGGRRPCRSPASGRRPWSARRREPAALELARHRGGLRGRGRHLGQARRPGPGCGAKDHSRSASGSPSASTARALATAASTFARLRTIPASASSRSTSASVERGHRDGVEPGEGGPEGGPLAQDRQPRQPRLERLQADLLEQRDRVVHGPAPLLVVVAAVHLGLRAPGAPGHPVGAEHDHAHAARGACLRLDVATERRSASTAPRLPSPASRAASRPGRTSRAAGPATPTRRTATSSARAPPPRTHRCRGPPGRCGAPGSGAAAPRR